MAHDVFLVSLLLFSDPHDVFAYCNHVLLLLFVPCDPVPSFDWLASLALSHLCMRVAYIVPIGRDIIYS